ncbi:MAG: DUF2812 domain-containing protein [Clostridiaceae bacterium]
MRKSICKWFFAWDFDKEEKWLNNMAARGLALVAVHGIFYTFEQSEPGEYGIRIELLNNMPSFPESEEYIHFVESTGAEHIGSTFRWVYFRKKKANGTFDLFSDFNCRIRHLNRVLWLLVPVIMIFLSGAINFTFRFLDDFHDPAISVIAILEIVFLILSIYGVIRLLILKHRLKREHRLYE